ncbi:hypothetical protein AnigIFM60653_002923 [Aspergillus niger]|nr:hypothetical protein AnigIFM60653_002923 [Aspergillus niger]
MPQESKFLDAKSKPVTGRGSLGVLRRSLEEAGGVIRLACVANPVGARTPRNSRSISINQETSDGLGTAGPVNTCKMMSAADRNQRAGAGNRQKTLGGFWWATEEISRESRRLQLSQLGLPGFEVNQLYKDGKTERVSILSIQQSVLELRKAYPSTHDTWKRYGLEQSTVGQIIGI